MTSPDNLREQLSNARIAEEEAHRHLEDVGGILNRVLSLVDVQLQAQLQEAEVAAGAATRARRRLQREVDLLDRAPTRPRTPKAPDGSPVLRRLEAYRDAVAQGRPGLDGMRRSAHLALIDLRALRPKAGLTLLPDGHDVAGIQRCIDDLLVFQTMEAVDTQVPPSRRAAIEALEEFIQAIDLRVYQPTRSQLHTHRSGYHPGVVALEAQRRVNQAVQFERAVDRLRKTLDHNTSGQLDLTDLRATTSSALSSGTIVHYRTIATGLRDQLQALEDSA